MARVKPSSLPPGAVFFSATNSHTSVSSFQNHTASHTWRPPPAQWFVVVSVVSTPSVDHQCPTFKLNPGSSNGGATPRRLKAFAIFVAHNSAGQITRCPSHTGPGALPIRQDRSARPA